MRLSSSCGERGKRLASDLEEPMKSTARIGVLALLSSASVPAQESEVRTQLEAATRLQAEKDVAGVLAALRKAELALVPITDVLRRSELKERLDTVARAIDPLFDDRADLNRKLGKRFTGVAEKLLEARMPRTAKLALGDAEAFDPVEAAPITERAETAVAAQVKGSDEARSDTAAAILLSVTSRMNDVLERAKKLNEQLPLWIEARIESGQELVRLAVRYQKKGHLELAYEVARLASRVDGGGAADVFNKILGEVSKVRAKHRYENAAKASMDELRKGSVRLGSKKSWKFKGMDITAPALHKRPSILVSKGRLAGDYQIEVDVQIVQMVGQIQVIAAWHSKDDYTVLEFERPRANYSMLRLVHFAKGRRKLLAEQRAIQTMASFFRLNVEVRAGQVAGSLGEARCRAALPTERGEGWGVGFVRPALRGKPARGNKKRVIRLRNFVLRALE